MSLLKNIFKSHHYSVLNYCTKPKPIVLKPIVTLNEKLNEDLENERLKPRHHSGIVRPKLISLPDDIVSAIKASTGDTPIRQLFDDGKKLTYYLRSRQGPTEEKDIFRIRRKLKQDVLGSIPNAEKMSELDDKDKKYVAMEVNKMFYKKVYNWKPVIYDSHTALSYLIGRSAAEYSVILKIFMEIAQRHPEFQPNSFFDFGAGVGTGIWAASTLWKKTLYEYFLVDSAREMNNLSDLILRGGHENKHMQLRNVYYRQFLPASNDVKFDLVLCAFSLFELPDMRTRVEVLLNLWNKCDGYLVIVDRGSKAGFNFIEEARDFLTHQFKEDDSAYVFAPCPHDQSCPHDKDTPCNFLSRYMPLPLGDRNISQQERKEPYSYVVFKKGSRNTGDETSRWPRILEPTLIRSGHTICRMCTQRGKLEEVIFTKSKHSKYTYRCAKASSWGDRLPVKLEDPET